VPAASAVPEASTHAMTETTTGVGETSTMEVVTHAMAEAVAEFAVPAIVSAVR
jgi:hypothetical protein